MPWTVAAEAEIRLFEAQRNDFPWLGNEGSSDKSPKLPNMELTEQWDTIIPFLGGDLEMLWAEAAPL